MKIDYTVPCGTTIELAGDSEHRKKDIDNHAGDVGYLCFLISTALRKLNSCAQKCIFVIPRARRIITTSRDYLISIA